MVAAIPDQASPASVVGGEGTHAEGGPGAETAEDLAGGEQAERTATQRGQIERRHGLGGHPSGA